MTGQPTPAPRILSRNKALVRAYYNHQVSVNEAFFNPSICLRGARDREIGWLAISNPRTTVFKELTHHC